MSFQNCFIKLGKVLKESDDTEGVTKARMGFIAKQLQNIAADSLTPDQFKQKARQFIDEDFAREQAKAKAGRALNLYKSEQLARNALQNIDKWTKEAPKDPSHAFEATKAALIGGAVKPGFGTNESPYQAQTSVRHEIWKVFTTALGDLESTVKKTPALDRNMWLALNAIDNKLPLTNFTPDEINYAKGIKAGRDKIFSLEQSLNPWLMKSDEYLFQTIHDRGKITAAGEKAWVDRMMRDFSQKSFPEMDPAKKPAEFAEVYKKIASGKQGSMLPDQMEPTKANIFRRQAAQRSLIPDNATKWADYVKDFGPDSAYDAFGQVASRAARDVALLNKFGPIPEDAKNRLISRVESSLSGEALEHFQANKPKLDDIWDIARGANNSPAYGRQAKFVEGALTQAWLSRGGMGLFHAIPSDMMLAASLIHQIHDTGMIRAWSRVAYDYVKALSPAVRAANADNAQYITNAMQREVLWHLGAPEAGGRGWMTNVSNWMSRWSGHNLHADMMASVMGGWMTREMGKLSGTEYAALPNRWKIGLNRAGFDEKAWNLIRLAKQQIGPDAHLTPEGIEHLVENHPEVAENYLRSTDQLKPSQNMSAAAQQRISDELSMKLGAMINEHISLASGRTDLRQRSLLYGSDDINSGRGQFWRLINQFQGPQAVALDVAKRGYHTTGGSWEIPVKQIVGTMVLTAIATGIKEAMTEGKTPSNPLVGGDLKIEPILENLAHSGALGIYGRFLQGMLGQHSAGDRLKGMALAGAGPVLKNAAQGALLSTDAISYLGPNGRGKNLGKDTANYVIGQEPTFPYSKILFDYIINNRIREMAHAGAMASQMRHTAKTPGLLEDRQRFLTPDGQPPMLGR